MPGRLPALSVARFQQGARRMEPDGAVLQCLARSGDRRLRGIHRLLPQADARFLVVLLAPAPPSRAQHPKDALAPIRAGRFAQTRPKSPALELRRIAEHFLPSLSCETQRGHAFETVGSRQSSTQPTD